LKPAIPLLRSLAFLVIALAVPLDAALACSCMRMTGAETIAKAKVAFAGTVESVRNLPGHQQRATVKVSERLKGDVPATIEVTTSTMDSLCGYPLQSGRSYRFAGTPDADGRLPIGLCTMLPLNMPK
jgi:hypothetical protein